MSRGCRRGNFRTLKIDKNTQPSKRRRHHQYLARTGTAVVGKSKTPQILPVDRSPPSMTMDQGRTSSPTGRRARLILVAAPKQSRPKQRCLARARRARLASAVTARPLAAPRTSLQVLGSVAGELGLEPRTTVPKTAVLPLHHSPAGTAKPRGVRRGGGDSARVGRMQRDFELLFTAP